MSPELILINNGNLNLIFNPEKKWYIFIRFNILKKNIIIKRISNIDLMIKKLDNN